MKNFAWKSLVVSVWLAVGLIFAGCGGSDDTINYPPVANAGPDQNVTTSSLVTLDGSNSRDANGQLITYRWSFNAKPAGSAATLSGPTSVKPTFTADLDGDYVVRLVVNDGTLDSSPDTVTVTAATANSAPVANAGPDRNVTTSSLVTLDGGGSSDADGDTLSYLWSFDAVPTGSTATLAAPSAVDPTFTADLDGDYVVRLVVNDGTVDSSPDTVVITAATVNSAPVANAGPDQNVTTSDLVTLDGSGSSDADGDLLTNSWSFVSVPPGSTAAFSDPTAVNPTFTADLDGDYVVNLVVNDGTVDSSPDTVVITAATPSVSGTLDTTFNGTGYVTHGNAARGVTDWNDTGKAIIVDPSGKIVVAGGSVNVGWNMVVWRYNDDGSLDTTFGDDGDGNGTPDGWLVRADALGSGDIYDLAHDIIPDGTGYLVTGEVDAGFSLAMILRRFDSSGADDLSFGSSGLVAHSGLTGNGSNTRGFSLVKDASGNVMVTGSDYNQMILWRFSSAGVLDTTFGGDRDGDSIPDGYYRPDIINTTTTGMGVARSGNDILVAGYTGQYGIPADMALWSFPGTGVDNPIIFDASDAGLIAPSTQDVDDGEDLAVDGSGNTVVAGHFYDGNNWNPTIWRYTAAGALDTTFNSGGTVPGVAVFDSAAAGFIDAKVYALAIDSQGRIILAGEKWDGNARSDMVVWRYNSDGTPDTTFNAGDTPGYLVHDNAAGGSGNDGAYGVTVDANDRIYLTGYSVGSQWDMAIWRINP